MTTPTSEVKPTYSIVPIVCICIVSALGGFLFGFDSGVINGTIDGLNQAFGNNSVTSGFNVASMLLGCAIGAVFAGKLSDIYGRRSLLHVAALFFIISAWGSGISVSSSEFIVYRIMGGLAVGAASILTPAYISEISPSSVRGRLSSIQQIAILVGVTIAFVSNFFIAKYAGGSTQFFLLELEAWRWMFWIEIVPATLFLIGLCFIPESPRFLVLKGKREKSQRILTSLFGAEGIQLQEEIVDSLYSKTKATPSQTIQPRFPFLRPILLVGIGLACLQQFVGINIVFYYGAILWQTVGYTESDALFTNILVGGVSIVAVGVAMLLIDKIGRKPLLLTGSIIMTICLFGMVAAFSSAVESSTTGITLPGIWGPIALISALMYAATFNFSWGPVMWVMLAEMFPNRLRGTGLAVAGAAQWISNFLITLTFPILLAHTSLQATYSIYALSALFSTLFVIFWVKETKGIKLENMVG